MPNHLHGIIYISDTAQSVGAGQNIAIGSVGIEQCSVPTQSAPTMHYGLLSKIVKAFKEATVKGIRKEFYDYNFAWQRSFHDHVIRNDKDLKTKREYIAHNPVNWESDRNNPKYLLK